MKNVSLILVIMLLILTGCIGVFFAPGYSCTDKDYFAEPPVIVKRGEQFWLRWHYGLMGFYFRPRCAIKNDVLCFSLQGTSSSGSLAGKEGKMLIEGQPEIVALKNGGAIWWSLDGSRTPLILGEEPAPRVLLNPDTGSHSF